MMRSEHIGDAAELYALGQLDRAERAAVDQHLTHCDDCLRRVGEAEETALALEQCFIPLPAPPELGRRMRFGRVRAFPIAAALAAAFLIGLLPSVPLMLQRASQSQRDVAMVAMLNSHFNHSQFSGAASAPLAKVIYDRAHTWLYIVVDGAHRYDVYAHNGTAEMLLGTTQPNGSTSELFVKAPPALDGAELHDGASIVERAKVLPTP
jgi:anti-sigma factor RsiW